MDQLILAVEGCDPDSDVICSPENVTELFEFTTPLFSIGPFSKLDPAGLESSRDESVDPGIVVRPWLISSGRHKCPVLGVFASLINPTCQQFPLVIRQSLGRLLGRHWIIFGMYSYKDFTVRRIGRINCVIAAKISRCAEVGIESN